MNSAPEMFLVFIIKNVSYPFLKIHIILCLLSSHLTDLLVFFTVRQVLCQELEI